MSTGARYFLTFRTLDGWDAIFSDDARELRTRSESLYAWQIDSALIVEDASSVVVWRGSGRYLETDAPFDPPPYVKDAQNASQPRGNVALEARSLRDWIDLQHVNVGRSRVRRQALRDCADACNTIIGRAFAPERFDADAERAKLDDIRSHAHATVDGI